MNNKIKTDKAPEPVGNYPHARRVKDLLFLSGVGPRKPGTNVIPGVMMDGQGNPVGHDIEVQCHSVSHLKPLISGLNSPKRARAWQNIYLMPCPFGKGHFTTYRSFCPDIFLPECKTLLLQKDCLFT